MGKRGPRLASHSERHQAAWDGKYGPNRGVRANRCNIPGWVYFIGPVDAETVKIGWTKDDPYRRLKALQTGNGSTLHLYGAIPGTRRDEKALHVSLSHLHLRGEWFAFSEEIFDLFMERAA